MNESEPFDASEVIANIPHGAFILTAAHDGNRSGTLVRWVQPCSVDPPMLMLAIPKGQVIEPLIRDSHCFALCQVREGDRFLIRKFDSECNPDRDRNDDPFICLPTHCSPSGSPVIERALSFIDCDVSRQVEVEGDHRLYVGLITYGEILQHEPPAVFCGRNNAA